MESRSYRGKDGQTELLTSIRGGEQGPSPGPEVAATACPAGSL